MLTLANNDIGTAIRLAQSDVVPTAPQLATLKAEIDSDPSAQGYAGKTTSQQVQLLCLPLTIPNPTAQATITHTPWAPGALVAFLETQLAPNGTTNLVDYILSLTTSANAAIKTGALRFQLYMQSSAPFDPTTTVNTAFVNSAVTAAIFTQAVANAIQTMPDPTWQPTIQQSRMVAIGLAGLVPTARDLVGL